MRVLELERLRNTLEFQLVEIKRLRPQLANIFFAFAGYVLRYDISDQNIYNTKSGQQVGWFIGVPAKNCLFRMCFNYIEGYSQANVKFLDIDEAFTGFESDGPKIDCSGYDILNAQFLKERDQNIVSTIAQRQSDIVQMALLELSYEVIPLEIIDMLYLANMAGIHLHSELVQFILARYPHYEMTTKTILEFERIGIEIRVQKMQDAGRKIPEIRKFFKRKF